MIQKYPSRYRKKPSSSKKRILITIAGVILLSLIFRWGGSSSSSTVSPKSTTGDTASITQSGATDTLPSEATDTVENTDSNSQNTESQNTEAQTTESQTTDATTTETTTETPSVEEETTQKQASNLFPVALCNQIINLYSCIIQKAPIENQPLMQQNLQQAIQSWHLLTTSQLTQVCDTIVSQETFQQVKNHYTQDSHNCPF